MYGGRGYGKIDIAGPSITLTGSLIFEEAVYVKNPTTVDVGGDALFYGDAKEGKSHLDVTAGGKIQFGRPMDNFKNYLPTLFTLTNQRPVTVAKVDSPDSRQIGVGNLQVVNIGSSSAPADGTGGSSMQDVGESMVNQTVGEIVADDNSRSMTYIVAVRGGVRVVDGTTEESQ